MPLGEHLRTHHNAGLAAANGAEQGIHRAFACGAVAVNAQHWRIRE